MNQHVAIRLAKVDIQRTLAVLALCPGLEIDEQLKLSMLEGETELNEIVSALLAENEDDEAVIEGCKRQIESRRERMARMDARIEARRNAILSLMNAAELHKLPLPEATISVRSLGSRPKVTDEDALPDDFCKFVRKPDMAAISEAVERREAVPGVTMTNGGQSLSVRRK